MSKRYDCCTPRPKRDGGVWWHKVGTAWENDRGVVTVFLDSVPVPDVRNDNKIVFTLFEATEKPKAEEPPKVTTKEEMEAYTDDAIPF